MQDVDPYYLVLLTPAQSHPGVFDNEIRHGYIPHDAAGRISPALLLPSRVHYLPESVFSWTELQASEDLHNFDRVVLCREIEYGTVINNLNIRRQPSTKDTFRNAIPVSYTHLTLPTILLV